MEKFFNSIKNFVRCDASDTGIKIIAYLGMLMKFGFAYYQHHRITVVDMRAIRGCEKWKYYGFSDESTRVMDSYDAMTNIPLHFMVSVWLFAFLTFDFCVLYSTESRKASDLLWSIFFYIGSFIWIFAHYFLKFINYGIFDGYALLFLLINGHFLLSLCSFYYKLREEKAKRQEGSAAVASEQTIECV